MRRARLVILFAACVGVAAAWAFSARAVANPETPAQTADHRPDPAPPPAPAPVATVGPALFLPAASAPFIPRSKDVLSGHGWLALPVPSTSGATSRPDAVVLHLPPRDSADRAPSGTLRQAIRLTQVPEALAAWGDRVYIIFPRERGTATDSGFQRRVVSLSAQPTVPGLWDYQAGASGGGSQTLPLLEGENAVIAATGTPAGPLLLTRAGTDGLGPWQLLGTDGLAWRVLPLPWDAGDAVVWATMVSGLDGLTLLAERGDAPGRLIVARARWGAAPVTPAAGAPEPPVLWLPGTETLRLPPELSAALHRVRVALPDGQLILVARAGDSELTIYSAPSRGGAGADPARAGLEAARIASVTLPPPPGAVLWLDGLGRVVAIGEEAGPGVDADGARSRAVAPLAIPKLAVREVSVFSGTTMYSGPARAEGLISGRDLQVLTLIVAGVMLAILMFVLRSDEQGVIPLPTGVALATPLRRSVAAGLDLGLPVFLVSAAFGVAPESLLSWAMFSNREELLPALCVWGGTFAHCVLGEWLGGASIGKRLMRIRVVAITSRPVPGPADSSAAAQTSEPAPEPDEALDTTVGSVTIGRPSLRRALLRNLVRWGAPPLGLLMLADENWRHPGDVLAHTVVVVPPSPLGEDEG